MLELTAKKMVAENIGDDVTHAIPLQELPVAIFEPCADIELDSLMNDNYASSTDILQRGSVSLVACLEILQQPELMNLLSAEAKTQLKALHKAAAEQRYLELTAIENLTAEQYYEIATLGNFFYPQRPAILMYYLKAAQLGHTQALAASLKLLAQLQATVPAEDVSQLLLEDNANRFKEYLTPCNLNRLLTAYPKLTSALSKHLARRIAPIQLAKPSLDLSTSVNYRLFSKAKRPSENVSVLAQLAAIIEGMPSDTKEDRACKLAFSVLYMALLEDEQKLAWLDKSGRLRLNTYAIQLKTYLQALQATTAWIDEYQADKSAQQTCLKLLAQVNQTFIKQSQAFIEGCETATKRFHYRQQISAVIITGLSLVTLALSVTLGGLLLGPLGGLGIGLGIGLLGGGTFVVVGLGSAFIANTAINLFYTSMNKSSYIAHLFCEQPAESVKPLTFDYSKI